MAADESTLSIVAIIVALASAAFTAMQAIHSRHQTKIQGVASELSFNLEVMVRLDIVLKEIAEQQAIYDHVWTANPPTRPPQADCLGHVMTVSLIDAIELALQATKRLPGFAINAEDWNSYADYVFGRSEAVRQEVGENGQWWPATYERLMEYEKNQQMQGISASAETPKPPSYASATPSGSQNG